MALMICPECGHKVSSSAVACPECAFPLRTADAPEPAEVDATGPRVYSPEQIDRITSLRRETQVVEASKWSSSLGIGSIVMGSLAFAVCWVPILGMIGAPLSALGGIMALCGIAISMTRKGAGIGFPFAGLAICGVAFFVMFAMTHAVVSGIENANKAINGTHSPITSSTVLIDADRAALVDDVAVQIDSVTVGKVAITDLLQKNTHSKDDLLYLTVTLTNNANNRKVDYKSWAPTFAFGNTGSMTDNFSNAYKRINFGIEKVVGHIEQEAAYPGKSISDILVFEKPLDTIEFLVLSLPGENFGAKGEVHFKIMKSQIAGF